MQTTVVNTFNDKTNERVSSRYYVGDNQVSFEQYAKFMDDLYSNDGSDDNNTDIENGNVDEFAVHPCQCAFCKGKSEQSTDNVTNIYIDSLNITGVSNAKDLINQLEKYGKMQRGEF